MKEPITCRPADLIEPQLEKFKNDQSLSSTQQQDEDVLIIRTCSHRLLQSSLSISEAQQTKVDAAAADTQNKAYPV